jgi:hypothetical protein
MVCQILLRLLSSSVRLALLSESVSDLVRKSMLPPGRNQRYSMVAAYSFYVPPLYLNSIAPLSHSRELNANLEPK